MVKSFELIKNQCDFISLQNRHSLIHHDHRKYNTKNSKNQNNIKEFIKIVFHRKKISDFFVPSRKIALVFIFCSAGPDPVSQAASPTAPCLAFFDWHSLG
jgi:hypothetical protein